MKKRNTPLNASQPASQPFSSVQFVDARKRDVLVLPKVQHFTLINISKTTVTPILENSWDFFLVVVVVVSDVFAERMRVRGREGGCGTGKWHFTGPCCIMSKVILFFFSHTVWDTQRFDYIVSDGMLNSTVSMMSRSRFAWYDFVCCKISSEKNRSALKLNAKQTGHP